MYLDFCKIYIHKNFISAKDIIEVIIKMNKKAKAILISTFLFSSLGITFASQPTIIYKVQSGDNMWKICSKYNITLQQLLNKNPQLSKYKSVQKGQTLNIPETQSTSSIQSEEAKVVQLVNKQRAAAGLPALTQNFNLCKVARLKSQDMINKKYFSHMSPTYGSPFKMMETFGIKFSAAGENIAMGQRNAAEVMNSWMNSPGHRSNILSPSYTQIGVGLAKDSSGRCYWTQQFIKPMW
jgi:uncharacterized YkwD family protein